MITDKEAHHYVVHVSRTWMAKSKAAAHTRAQKLARQTPGETFSVISCYTTGYRKGKRKDGRT